MKYLVQIVFLVFMLSSCKTTKEVKVVEEEKVVSDKIEEKMVSTATHGKSGRSDRLLKSKVDPKSIVSQLNMSESQEGIFLDYWKNYQSEMDKLRLDSNKGKSGVGKRISAFKASSDSEVKKILTQDQYAQYQKIMAIDRMNSRREN